jgi:DNA-binding GntR family transcriptional regulator
MSNATLDNVRDRILSGKLGADCWIKQDVLAAELGISKIPLREALRKLEQEGLVKSEANRGFFVRPIVAAEAEDIFALRLKIEPDAVMQAAKAAGAYDRNVAVAALGQLEHAIDANSTDVAKLNRAFHVALVAPAHKLITADMVERLHILAERYVRMHLLPNERGVRANREHRELLDAWMARDHVVEQLAHAHIAETLNDLREQLR